MNRRFARVPLQGTPLSNTLEEVIAVREHATTPFSERPKELQWLVVLLHERGAAIHDEGERKITVRAGALVVQPRGLVCADRTARVPWRNRYLLVRGPLADGFQSEYWQSRPAQTEVYQSPAGGVRRALNEAIENVFEQPVGHSWGILTRVVNLFHALLESPPPDRPEADLLTRAVRLVEADIGNPWRVDDLAAALEMHPKGLSRWFTERIGRPPGQWVRQQRMQIALRFLRQGMSVSATAELLGFPEPTAFSRQFRAVMGDAPSRLRSLPPSRYSS